MGSYGQSQILITDADVKHRLETSNEVSMMESNNFGGPMYVIRSAFGHSMPLALNFHGDHLHTHTHMHTNIKTNTPTPPTHIH